MFNATLSGTSTKFPMNLNMNLGDLSPMNMKLSMGKGSILIDKWWIVQLATFHCRRLNWLNWQGFSNVLCCSLLFIHT